ncbi:hypothetical protein [Secundilactobacillus kimchicus]|uniref:hypothetical protein n=1 Tax=Secundilactobacillus kimchicus TaxID=528209 RepID=UPI0006D0959A|nr:hypothetical protein [Secundilactobacillus kimchicus]
MMKQLKLIKQLKSGSQKALACFAVLMTAVFVGTAHPANAAAKPGLAVRSAIAIDADSGRFFTRNRPKRHYRLRR